MRAFREHSASRLLVAVAMMLSWLVMTNHCALAGFVAKARAGQNAVSASAAADEDELPPCHRHQAVGIGGHGSHGGQVPENPCLQSDGCCKGAKALVSQKVDLDRDVLGAACWVAVLTGIVEIPADAAALEIDLTGSPPGVHSFAELVLQQSLLSHAPPFIS